MTDMQSGQEAGQNSAIDDALIAYCALVALKEERAEK